MDRITEVLFDTIDMDLPRQCYDGASNIKKA